VRVSDIPTPALLVDAVALDRNIRRMAAFFSEGPCRLRPHFKAHKTPEIARRQLAAGSCTGLTCATVREAEVAAEFCDDILIANEIVGADRCARVAALADRLRARSETAALTVAVDSLAGLEQLGSAARSVRGTIGVLVDIDVGQHRCGVSTEEGVVTLARAVAGDSGLRFRGVMGYEGHVQPVRDPAARAAAARDAMSLLLTMAGRLDDDGFPCAVVSAGGTGTYDISGRTSGVTEVQAGSYALMDTDYAAVGMPFEQAFWVLGTVVSRPVPERCVLDCGHKALTKDHGLPSVHGLPDASVTALNDEHAVIALPPGARVTVGDRIRLVPSHTDPTVNLHERFHVVDGDRIVETWEIAARGWT
jgi:D-serine deaminase-like pyridoxal phosphate-dependent protein